ncbi:hypothetical protein BGZ94_001996 [Podila epigama]|nr:hypothetical protein BGZ94_001996 [Podila epigama]
MSPSLPPPPRKLSTSSTASIAHSTSRCPKVNPTSVADNNSNNIDDEDDDNLDQALAELLGQSSLHSDPLSGYAYSFPHQPQQQQQQHCRHRARPQSIISTSSLGSSSNSSYSTGTHSRRVSQAYLSPLSPTFSEHSTSYFTDCVSCHSPTCPARAALEQRDQLLSPTLEECDENATNQTGLVKELESNNTLHMNSADHEQEMGMSSSSAASCTCASSVRSNSICSVGTQDDGKMFQSFLNNPSSPHHHHHHHHIHQHRHNVRHSSNLYAIYDPARLASLREIVPTEVRHRLSFHLDECWFVNFSPSGEYLASTGRDHSILIWAGVNTPEPTVYRSIQFARTVTQIEWSPDSKYLLVNLGFDVDNVGLLVPEFKVYQVATGDVILTRRHQNNGRDIHVKDIGWFPDSKRFVTAPESGPVTVWNLDGEIVFEATDDGNPVYKLEMIPGQELAVVVTSENAIEIIAFDGKTPSIRVDQLADKPPSLTVSDNASYIAVTMKGDPSLCRLAQVLVYDLPSQRFIKALEADTYVDEQFVIKAAFWGPRQELVCAGSETGKLHFWDIESAELISVLDEHSQHCGWLSFNIAVPGMMASCSDDNHIIIWVTKDLSRTLQDEDDAWIEQHTVVRPPLNIKNGW